jgi:tRNA threonylcarbamoyl adenosine modification protein (Sua5/YciO/YrdC/YwlC family)
MAAEILTIYSENIDPRAMDKIITCLQDGGVIIYPTDTVYAMGCDFKNAKAIEKLCKIKGINPKKANFAFICEDLSHISEYARVSNPVFRLIKKALPGPFTFIFEATNDVPKLLQTSKKEVGIRVPEHEIPIEIVSKLGNPILTTSIKDDEDIFNEYPNEIEWIFGRYENEVDIIIDGGWCGITPSTVVTTIGDNIEVVRQGLGDLEDFL